VPKLTECSFKYCFKLRSTKQEHLIHAQILFIKSDTTAQIKTNQVL